MRRKKQSVQNSKAVLYLRVSHATKTWLEKQCEKASTFSRVSQSAMAEFIIAEAMKSGKIWMNNKSNH